MTKDRERLNRSVPSNSTPNARSAGKPVTQNGTTGTTTVRRPAVPGRDAVVTRGPKARSGKTLKARTLALLTDWRFFTLVGLSLTGGLTAFSIAFLFKLPVLPNCPSVFWPLASGSMRLHCAQLAAGKETVPDLLEAIKLLNTLGDRHPLYAESSRLIELWSTEILELVEKDFQAGKLKEAIAGARQIPTNSAAAKLVDDRVKSWEKIWQDAEKIYTRAGDFLKKANWRDAQVESSRLLSVENNFWQTTKYQELSVLIVSTREDINKLGAADRAIDSGIIDDLIKAVQEVASIGDKSYVHKEAQTTLPKLGRKLLELAQIALDRKDYNGAVDIANRIPGAVNLGKEVDDFRTIATAQSKAWSGGVLNLEEAIADAQRIGNGRPLYDKAQRLIATWQVQVREVAQLDQAKKLAQAGDLQNAIAQASQISGSSQAAKDFVQETTVQIQDTQDRPILEQAAQIAMAGDAQSLETAIAQAKQIGSGRSLFPQAKEKIRQWSDQLKQLRTPVVEAARPFTPVVPPAASIAPAVVGSPAATQPAIVQDNGVGAEQAMLDQAKGVASGGTPDGLLQAIGMAQSLPDASPMRGAAVAAVDQWSQQLVQVAQYQAEFDVLGAINIAGRVPADSSAYGQAQELIVKWRKSVGQ